MGVDRGNIAGREDRPVNRAGKVLTDPNEAPVVERQAGLLQPGRRACRGHPQDMVEGQTAAGAIRQHFATVMGSYFRNFEIGAKIDIPCGE